MLHLYDPQKIVVIYAGQIITGFADGTFVSVEQNEDTFGLQVGVDGNATRTKSNNRSGKITLTLSQSSISNPILSGLHEIDRQSPIGGIAPMQVKDLTGSSLHAAEKMWITKPATSAYGKDPDTREWVFETDNLYTAPGAGMIR